MGPGSILFNRGRNSDDTERWGLGHWALIGGLPGEKLAAVVVLLLGSPLDIPTGLSGARDGGSGLLSLGVACWLARDDSESRAARGLVAAMLLYDLAAVAVLAFAGFGFGLHGVALWPPVILHAVMTVWCVACLRRRSLNVTMERNS